MPSSLSNLRSAMRSATQSLIGQLLSLGFRINEIKPSMVDEFCIRSNQESGFISIPWHANAAFFMANSKSI
jgi:hypothetical protein